MSKKTNTLLFILIATAANIVLTLASFLVLFLATYPEVLGSIPVAARFSEK